MIGAELRLTQAERLLVQSDRLGRPPAELVGIGQVITALQRVGVIRAQRRLAHGAGPGVQAHGPVVQAQAEVGHAEATQQGAPSLLRAGEPRIEPHGGAIQDFGDPDLSAVQQGVGAAERIDQELSHRLGLLPRRLRAIKGRLEPVVGLRLDDRHGTQPDHAGR